ncbi:hypothetical protein Csp2054_09020 [Curtobacterium sp. 'Ferrero']|uniref:hypothetical protein n=1 Tax=Curtobacterium sp. 'Ferrero' TaxID=2033654 RepID=UPI000BC8F937|nr:hypothetical protein [Curtobacterium sp. 'Ferrero']PCN48004.1 hypothetical protein Csp2054_09020 [Curtobacterium sp. 'Ferrero']
MNKLELSKLLTTFSLVDHRNVDPETVNAWYDVLGDLDVDFAYRAGVEHFRESTDYLTAAHIVAGAMRLQKRNAADVREGQARGVVPSDWPASRALTPQLADALAADRVARSGVWIGKSWFESWDDFHEHEEQRVLAMEKAGSGAIARPAEPAAQEYLR